MRRTLAEIVAEAVHAHTELVARICRCGHIAAETPWGAAMERHVAEEISAALTAAGFGYVPDAIRDASDCLPLFRGRTTAALYLHSISEKLHAEVVRNGSR